MIQWTFTETSVTRGRKFNVDPETGTLVVQLRDEIEQYMLEHNVKKYENPKNQVIQFGAVTLYFPSHEILVDFRLRFT